MAMPTSTVAANRDYSSVSAYLESREIHFYEGEGSVKKNNMIELQPPRSDVGNNPTQMPSALGKNFAQGDFSHGSGQPFAHYESSDEAKYLHSEGFDIATPGLLKHLPAVLANATSLTGGAGRQAQSQGALYVAHGNELKKYASPSAVPSSIDVQAGESATAVRDVTAEGDRKFVALGANGIHLLDSSDTDSHYSDAQAILVSFLKDRLIACSARNLYEITASGAAPAATLTLKEGWTFTDLGENGEYVYATAINETAGLSKVYHFGLDGSLNFVAKGSTWLPNNELAYSFKGYLGIVFLGCGRVNASGGKDALFYKAVPDGEGFLAIELVAESKGAGSRDLATRAFATYGRKVLLGWTLGASSVYGEREGLAIYDPALNSFAHHLASSIDTATPDPVLSVGVFAGRICFVTTDGLYYEDTTKYVATATLISSIPNWGDASLKNWDESEVATKKLPNTATVRLDYSTLHPEESVWTAAGTHSIPDATKATFRHANVEAARLPIRIVSSATTSQALAPEIEAFSVRSNPTTANTEWELIRTIHLLGTVAKGQRGGVKNYKPRDERNAIRALAHDWFNWHEVDASYYVRLYGMSEIKSLTNYSQTQGDQRKEEYVVVVALRGRVL